MSTLLSELDNVEARHGIVKALHGARCRSKKEKFATLLGANGAGKTTTLARDLRNGQADSSDRSRALLSDVAVRRPSPSPIVATFPKKGPLPSSPSSRTFGSAPTQAGAR